MNLDELRAAVVEAARRWYRSTNEAELAGAVQELEHAERDLDRGGREADRGNAPQDGEDSEIIHDLWDRGGGAGGDRQTDLFST